MTSSGTKKGELFLANVNTQLKRNNITTDINVDTNSNIHIAVMNKENYGCHRIYGRGVINTFIK
ncbi:putative porin, eukaryotic type [Helianthus anomalus]